MNAQTIQHRMPLHKLARFFYWCSLLLLLAGMWVLIDPFHRKTGATSHIYITLISFELYMWLLLVLGRWQLRHELISDAARVGLFTLALIGFEFFALNELYMAAGTVAYFITLAAMVSTGFKFFAAIRWLGIALPAPLGMMSAAWVLLLAMPAPLLKGLESSKSVQHLAAYGFCWVLAVFAGAHLPLVAWQKKAGLKKRDLPFGQWYVPWIILSALGFLAVVQIYSAMDGLFVGWNQNYFSPLGFAVAVVAITLWHVAGRKPINAWIFLAIAAAHLLIFHHTPLPKGFPQYWSDTIHLGADPLISNGIFVTLLFAMDWWLFRVAWMVPLAGMFPTGFAITRGFQFMLHKQQGRGIALVLASFLLLAAGAALQWMQINRKPENYAIEPLTDPVAPAGSPPEPEEPVMLPPSSNPDGDGPPAAFP